jgi:hypothetical protein
LSQISPFLLGSANRSDSTSLVPLELTTMKPTFFAPGASLTHVKRPNESSPTKGCPTGHGLDMDGSVSPQV